MSLAYVLERKRIFSLFIAVLCNILFFCWVCLFSGPCLKALKGGGGENKAWSACVLSLSVSGC